MSQVTVESRDLDNGVICTIAGVIDFTSSPELRASLLAVMQKKPSRLVLDLSQISYTDSSGVATFVEALQVQRQHGGKLILCCMQPRVQGIFEIARLDAVFTIVDDVETAMSV